MNHKLLSTNKTKLVIDTAIFISFLLAMDPRSTGIPIHEWLSLGLAAAIVVHLLLSWNWILEVTRRFLSKVTNRSRLNYVLNVLLLVDGTIIMLSGILISKAILPALGISLPESFVWRRLHSLSADLSILITGLHVGLHWSWIVNCVKRIFSRQAATPPVENEEAGI